MSEIYVAKNGGVIVSIVRAESEKLANAYWHGQGLFPHSVEVVPELPQDHPTGVIPILSTVDLADFYHNMSRSPDRGKYLVVSKHR